MRSVYIAVISIFLLFAVLVPAQAKPFARAFVVSDTVNINDYVVLSVLVEGGRYHSSPQLNPMPDFDIISSSQESQYTLIGAKMTNRTKFTYLMKAKKSGMYQVGEGNVKVDNTNIHLYPVAVTVLGTASPKQPAYKPTPTPGPPVSDLSSSYGNKDIIFEATIDNTDPYENQQVVYTASIYYRINLDNIDHKMPAFKDFVAEPLSNRKEFKTIINGAYYNVYQQAFALFPTKSGEVVIPASTITGRALIYNDPMDRFFGNYQYDSFELMSKPIKMNIKPLPKPPKGFKNSVGEFDINTSITKTTLKTGDSAKLELEITGKGNITNIQEPKFDFNSEFKKNFKIYKSTPKIQITDKTDYISGSKTYTYDLVALNPGDYIVPQAELICFDPEKKRYRQLRTDAIFVKVLPGEGGESLDLTKAAPEKPDESQITGIDEIIDVYRDEKYSKESVLKIKEYIILFIIFISPVIALILLYIYLRRQDYAEKNVKEFKSKYALKTAIKKLKKLKPYLDRPDNKLFFEMLDNVIKEYIGDKFNAPAGSLTSLEVEKKLKANGVSSNNVLLLSEIVKLCEELQYSSRKVDFNKTELALSDTIRILKSIEKEIKL